MDIKNYRNRKHKNEMIANLKNALDFTGKAIPITIIITTLVGGFQLLSFSKFHEINAVDFITSGVMVTFGGAYLLYYTVLLMLYIFMIIAHSSQNKFLYSSMIKKSSCQYIQNHPLHAQLIFSLLLSTWPFSLFSKNNSLEWFFFIILVNFITLLIYHNFITTDLEGEKIYSPSRLRTIIPALLPLVSFPVMTLSGMVASELLKPIGHNIPQSLINLILILISTAIIFFSFTPPAANESLTLPFAIYATPLIFIMFFILPNAASTYTPNAIIKIFDIGLQKRCYLSLDTDKSHIPENLQKKHNAITQLNITANIGDIYYLSKFDDPDMVSVFRFTAHDYKQIKCPQIH